MRVGSYHHSARERIVLEHHLMDDAGTRSPEANAIFQRNRTKEIVHLTVGLESGREVFLHTYIGTNQVVAMNRSRNSHTRFASIHELEQSHLSRSILHSHTVRAELNVIDSTLERLQCVVGIHMGKQHLLGVGQRTANGLPCRVDFLRV